MEGWGQLGMICGFEFLPHFMEPERDLNETNLNSLLESSWLKKPAKERVEIFSNLSMDSDEYMQCDKNHIIFDYPVLGF